MVYVWSDGTRLLYAGDRYGAKPLGLNAEQGRRHYVPNGVSKGTEVLQATEWGTLDRSRLACTGRKHPPYELVATDVSVTAAYITAVTAGAAEIRMRDLHPSK